MARLTLDDMDEYQRAAWLFVKQVGTCALWIDMGLGKTIIVLSHVAEKIFEYDWSRVLVVAPPLVAADSWPVEIATWQHTQHLTYQELDGDTANMREQLKRPFDIDGISIHKLQRLAKAFKKGDKVPWDCIVFDEASMLRSKKSKRWKSAVRLSAYQDLDVIELSGTPVPNGLHQAWAQIALLDGGKRLFPTYDQFEKHFFETNPYSRKIIPRAFAMKGITERIADICYTLREEDYVKLPPLRSVPVPIVLPPTVLAKYREFEKTSVLKFETETRDNPTIRGLSEGAMYGKLLQFAAGRVYTGDEEKTFIDVHDRKIERMKEIIEFSDGKPLLIARTWQHSKLRLEEHIPGIRALKTTRDMQAWNAGDIQFAQTHPASVGLGTNIQKGGSTLVWYDHPSDLELYLQLRKRLHRRGQEADHVTMMHLTAMGTIEEDLVYSSLVKKEMDQNTFREPMRRRIEDVRKELRNGR